MTDIQKPRRGSLAYRPRKRARKQMPTVNFWPESTEARLLGAAGYKAGMVQVSHIDDTESPNKGQEVSSAATIIEMPSMVAYGIRGYKGRKTSGDFLTSDEKILKKLGIKKAKAKAMLSPENIDSLFLLAYAQPGMTGIGKKHPEKMEIAIGGGEMQARLDFAKGLLGKELSPKDIFKPGEYVDVISVTKGKGWQGTAKRFGTALHRPKSTSKKRHSGTLGQWHPGYILYTIPRAGQMGYHKRTELNKRILKIGENPDDVNPKGGFLHYGFVKSHYIVLKGSVPGPAKRLVRIRLGTRMGAAPEPKITQQV
jgi:large subunit ribosomal protein L3